jgi:hypothetical protein
MTVNINLQNCDELHLSVSRFWVEWFACGKQQVFDSFVEAVTGIISGRVRILESYVLGNAAAARLQLPTEHGNWKTSAAWSNCWAVVPWPRDVKKSSVSSLAREFDVTVKRSVHAVTGRACGTPNGCASRSLSPAFNGGS